MASISRIPHPVSLPDLLSASARNFPDHGIGFVRPYHGITFYTFAELEKKALSVLAGMQEIGLAAGDRVILSLGRSEDIIPVLWACFIGGIIPALLQPPVSFTEFNPAAEKTEKVFALLGGPRMLLSHEHAEKWSASRLPADRLVEVAGLKGDPGRAVRSVPKATDIALIQFSSGSTGDPKGAMLTHQNLLVNTGDIIASIALEPGDVSVNWMPLYHDMGLIGFHITPVRVGVTQYFIDPVDFIKHPALWPDTISAKRCTITACPNFGQMLMNRYLGRRRGQTWDLSSVRILFNGAEPISVATMQAFLTAMKPSGLPSSCMFPAYGLAEATLAVTLPERHTGATIRRFFRAELLKGHAVEANEGSDTEWIELVELGRPLQHTAVCVADVRNRPVGEGVVGNILVQGQSCSAGYFGNPTASGEVFRNGWLHTGDLGFFHRGSLFVTGRTKDIIFINGVNFYAHDLETVALKADPSLEGKLVMAGVFDEAEGRDRLLVFLAAPGSEQARERCLPIRNYLSSAVGLNPDTFVLIRSADIPRTSSGKIQRYKMVERYVRGGFENVLRF